MSCNEMAADGVLAWLHVGDLRLAEAGAANHRDLGRSVALANALPPDRLDFGVLMPETWPSETTQAAEAV